MLAREGTGESATAFPQIAMDECCKSTGEAVEAVKLRLLKLASAHSALLREEGGGPRRTARVQFCGGMSVIASLYEIRLSTLRMTIMNNRTSSSYFYFEAVNI